VSFLVNQYSYIWIFSLLIFAAGIFLFKNKPTLTKSLAFGAIFAMIILGWVVLHPRQTLFLKDAQSVKAMIGAGTPVLLEFQSPY
jgi:hypothetical protein